MDFDLVINATAAGLGNEVPAIPDSAINQETVCYDMMYNIEKPTAFVDWALSHGAAGAFDGLGMLVEQAAAAFAIWRGVNPDSKNVIQSLRAGAS
jgi:shikimate dehydrogenase